MRSAFRGAPGSSQPSGLQGPAGDPQARRDGPLPDGYFETSAPKYFWAIAA
ncbi:hypothetical protein ABIC70_000406 [Methylobacterium sp. 1973]|nr:hypothetical protein SAMN02799643_03667 [Methylobacterium sp. UNCCL125]